MAEGAFTLSIDGERDAFARWLTRVSYAGSLDELDAVEVELTLDRPGQLPEVLKKVRAGAPFELGLGGPKVQGDLVRVSVATSTTGRSRILATGLEALHRLRHLRLAEVLELSKDKIAAQIIQKAGLTPKTQAVGATAGETVLLDAPMLATLKQLADERNYALVSDGRNLSFKPRSTPAPGATEELEWGRQVFAMELHHDLSEVLTGVKVTGRDFRKGVETVEYEARETDLRKISGGESAVALRKKIGQVPVVLNETIRCAAASDVKERAIAELQAAAERFASATLRCVLTPDLTVGRKLSVTGLPWPMTGPFLVRAVQHTLLPPGAQETVLEVFSDGLPKP